MSLCLHRDRLIAAVVVAGILSATVGARGQEPAPSVTQQELAAAVALYQAGQYPEALAAIQKFLAANKFSALLPEATYYQGWCLWSLKRYAEAAATYDRLAQQYPHTPLAIESALRVAECDRALDKLDDALTHYRQFQTTHPQHPLLPQAMLGEADVLRRQKDLTGSRAVLQKLLNQMNPQAPLWLDTLFLLGQVLNEQKDFAAAQSVFKQIAAHRANPRAVEGLFLQAETMFDNQRFAEAITYYKRVQSKPAILAALQAEIAALDARRGEYIRQGQLALYQSQRENLQQLLEKFRSANDLRAAALFRIANCYLTLGQPEEASVVYRQFLRLYPDDKLAEQAQFGLIQSLTERRQMAEVEEQKKAFETKYAGSKLLTSAEFLQAEAFFDRQEFERAIESYKKFLATSKDADLIETAQFRIASSQLGLQQFAAGCDALLKFLQQHPQSKLIPDVLFRLGRAHYEMSQVAVKAGQSDGIRTNLIQAAGYFDQLRTQSPQSAILPEATFQLGYMYSLLGAFDPANCDKAVAAFGDFVKRWPDFTTTDKQPLAPEATYQIARNQAIRGRFDEAAATYQQLVDRYPTAPLAPFAAFEIASVWAGAQQPAKINDALRRYVERFPNHTKVGDALYSIGWTLENDQKIDEALAAYRDLVDRAVARGDSLPDEFRNAAIAGEVRIATLLADRGQLADAVASCEEFIGKFSRHPLAVRTIIAEIAALYRKAKQVNAAYDRLDQLASRFVQVAAIRHAAATAEIELALSERDYLRANPAVQRLLADPDRAELPAVSLGALGGAFLKTDRFSPALETYQQMRDKFGTDPRYVALAKLGIAQAQLGLKNLNEAGKAFQELLAQTDAPVAARPEAELGLAKVFLAQAAGQPATAPANVKAVELLTRVLAGGKGELAGEAGFHLGKFFYEQRNDPKNGRDNCKTALAYFLRVSLLTGGAMGEEAAFRSGQCHECLGNIEAARNAYAGYLRRFAEGSFVKEARERLATLPAPKP